ncbi:MAG: Cell division protein FtsQ [Acidimicrobiales bacterium]|nr:MAG: FtsQ-type POTRA domain-containing protein [Actinomycetota bacterium]MBV6508748.1 Cell division protein FtsQ [Acidimicrobiales bacterium]RIK06515.1 MAG: hypothetical protein DCC48_06260 [Acidobacteriota bacterium]
MSANLAPPRSARPVEIIDPRIRERRIGVKRAAGRRRLRALVLLLLGMLVLSGLVLLSRSPLLDVDDVRVSGADSTAIANVVEQSGIHLGDPMLEVDTGGAAAAVEALPWVKAAEVARRWPGRIEIIVEEHEPAALVEGAGSTGLVSPTGEVIAERADHPGELPRIVLESATVPPAGEALPADQIAVLDVVVGLDPEIESLIDLTRVERAGTDPEIRFELAGGGEINFGEIELVEEKLVAISTLLSGQVVLEGLDTIDVRVPSVPVITRLPGFGSSVLPAGADGQIHPSEAVASDD